MLQTSLENHFIESNKLLTTELLHQVDEYVQSKIEMLQEYSSNPLLRDKLLKSNREFDKLANLPGHINRKDLEWTSASPEKMTPLMEGLVGNELSHALIDKGLFYRKKYGFNMISELFVTNKYGAVVAMSNRTTDYRQDDEQWWQNAKKDGLFIKDVEQDASAGDYVVGIALKLNDNEGNFIGVLKALLNIKGVINISKSIKQHEMHAHHTTMKINLVTRDGKLIYSSDESKKFMSNIPFLFPESVDLSHGSEHIDVHNTVTTVKEGEDEFLIVHEHSKGYRDYKGLGWILTVEHKKDEVFAPITDLTNRMMIISIAVTIFAILIGIVISTRVSKSIRKLRDAAVDIGKGNLDTVIDITSNDEIGQLANEFQLMAKNLNSTTVRLDEFAREVADRKQTLELLQQSKQDWMDTFNTITDAITIHDKNYNIRRANKAAQKALKLPGSLLKTSAKCFQHYHGTDSPPEKCPSCVCLSTGKPAVSEVFEPHLNTHIEIRSIPRFDRNNQLIGLIHVTRDISDRRKKEELIQTQLNRLNALRSIDKAIIGSIDLRISMDIFLDQVVAQLQIDAASVLLLNKHTQLLEYMASKGFLSSALKHTKLRLGESSAGTAAIEQRIVTIPDLRERMDGFISSKQFGSENFVTYIAVPLIAKGQVKGVLELFHRSPLNAGEDWMEFLEAIADQGAIAIDNATLFDELQRSNTDLTLAYDTTIEGWSRAMDLRDKEAEGHSRRVSDMTLDIARNMGIKEENLVHIRRGALLHDIGKIGVSDSILLKPGPLSGEEWIIMKKHPEYAYNMLCPIEYLRPAIDIPYCHHEKWDGTGYPRGMKGEEIPLAARIFAVVDVWDALNSDRPYRTAWPKDKVIDHIRSLSGSHFDPEVVEAFLHMESADVDFSFALKH
jgi:HD-GYP domain-containing protein (c-di-GMP phosphodiesterase class II)/HAMP domain-containing protein